MLTRGVSPRHATPRADMESAPTRGKIKGLETHRKRRRGAFYMLPCSFTLPLIPAGEQCSPAVKPPLCKGRWHGVAVTEGLWPCVADRLITQPGQSPRPLRVQLFEPGPLCRCATSPRTAGSHPLHKGAFSGRTVFAPTCSTNKSTFFRQTGLPLRGAGAVGD